MAVTVPCTAPPEDLHKRAHPTAVNRRRDRLEPTWLWLLLVESLATVRQTVQHKRATAANQRHVALNQHGCGCLLSWDQDGKQHGRAQDEYMVTTVASGEPGSPRPTNTGDHEPGASEGQGSRSRASELDMLAMTGHSESQKRSKSGRDEPGSPRPRINWGARAASRDLRVFKMRTAL